MNIIYKTNSGNQLYTRLKVFLPTKPDANGNPSYSTDDAAAKKFNYAACAVCENINANICAQMANSYFRAHTTEACNEDNIVKALRTPGTYDIGGNSPYGSYKNPQAAKQCHTCLAYAQDLITNSALKSIVCTR